jgi:hypothetical protein
MMDPMDLLYFGSGAFDGLVRRKSVRGIVKSASTIGALVVDARSPGDFFRAQELLRALFDDPRRPARVLHPSKLLALVANGDVETAFTIGRYGIAGVLEERALGELDRRVQRIAATPIDVSPLTTPAVARPRSTHLGPRAEGELPTVAIGYRHAPETLEVLDRYVRVLREHAHESSVFADVSTLIDVMVREGLTCQTNLATKAGVSHSGQYIGSFDFYRELRRTRYGLITDHPTRAIEMDVFIAVDEVVHETLHLLYLANELRAGIAPESTHFAEELSLTWWQAVVHNRVFPEWLADRHILEINDDFLLSEQYQEPRGFWKVATVFGRYAGYPWVPSVIAELPERASYIGERGDLADVIASFRARPEAAFALAGGDGRLAIPVAFDAYPPIPPTLRLAPPNAASAA